MMFKNFVVLTVYLYFIVTTGYGKNISKLIGGTSVFIEQYTFHVSVLWQGVHLCSGNIITPLHIVTTATCVTHDKNIFYSNLQILSGTNYQNNLDNRGKINNVQLVIIHKNYAPHRFWANDICILKLEKSLLIGISQSPIRIEKKIPLAYKNKKFRIIGWEKITDNYIRLSKIDTIASLDKVCKEFYKSFRYLHRYQLCYTTELDTQKITDGDSGSSIVTISRQSLFGIVSLVAYEPNNYIFIATKIVPYHLWFEEVNNE